MRRVNEEKIFLADNQKAEHRYKLLFERSSDALFIHDAEGWIKDANQKASYMLGYKPEELKQMNIKDFTPNWLKVRVARSLNQMKESGLSHSEHELIRKDGSTIYVSINASLFDPEEGLSLGGVRDISKNKQNENELKKLYTAVEQGPSVVVITDLKARIEYVNRKFQEVTGYTFEDVRGKNPRILNSGDNPKSMYREMWHNIKRGKEWVGEFINRKKNGETYWEEANISPVIDNAGKIVNYVKVAQDITERKKAEERLRENRNLLTTIINNLPGYLIVVDKERRIIIANNNWLNAAKNAYPEHNLNYGRYCYEVFAGRETPCLNCHLNKKFKDGMLQKNISEKDNILEKVTGKALEKLISPIICDDGSFLGYVEYAFDITALREAKIKAQESSKAKSDFLANMSHEIRTPLNGVIGFTNMLKKTVLNKAQAKFLDNISKSADSLLEIINDILDFSKIESGKLELNEEWVDLIELLKSSLDIIEYNAMKKDIQLLFESDEDIPKYVMIDSMRLRQIITNLLSNAVKFTEEGEIKLSVRLMDDIGKKDTVKIDFSVQDTGIGISEDVQEKIFESFSQADPSTTKRFGGTGLGLNISNKLLEMMGSRLELYSKPGEGSVFSFTLDLKRATPETDREIPKEEKNAQKTREQKSPALSPLNEVTVMIAEDNELNMELTEFIIDDLIENVNIVKAHDGKEAVKRYKEANPDIIFMDIQMPEMNGYQATRKIKKISKTRRKEPYIIALTAAVIKGEKEKALEAGMADFLPKPVKEKSLSRVLRNYRYLYSEKIVENPEHKVPVHFNREQLFTILKKREFVMERIMTTGRQSLDRDGKRLKQAYDEKDKEQLRQAAHKLKGMAAGMRFEILRETAFELEKAAENNCEFKTLTRLYQAVEDEIITLKEMLGS